MGRWIPLQVPPAFVQAIYAGFVLALMVLEGGVAQIVSLLGIVCGLLAHLLGDSTTLGAAPWRPATHGRYRSRALGGQTLPGSEAPTGASSIYYRWRLELDPLQGDMVSSSLDTKGDWDRQGTDFTRGRQRKERGSSLRSPRRYIGPACQGSSLTARPSSLSLQGFPRTRPAERHSLLSDPVLWVAGIRRYLGPLAIILLVGSPLVLRTAWPWMLVAAFCFLTAVGNFSRLALWALMHNLPVLSNMRVPSRFLIPFVFAACLLAGMVLDAMRQHLVSRRDGRRRWVDLAAGLLVTAALIDSMIVGRGSLQGMFPVSAPQIASRLPAIATITGRQMRMTEDMLANYCVLYTEEVIPFPISVLPRDDPGYLGELYFVPDETERATTAGRVELESWSPNSVRVRVTAHAPGFVVLNRNWEKGWTALPPYRAAPFQGLIAARAEPGSHSIAFLYRPRVVLHGTIVSLVTFVLAAAWVLCTHFTTLRPRCPFRKSLGPVN